MESVKTPCIGVCSTVFGDVVCRGCKRFVHEVIDWNSYNIEQKVLVKHRLAELSEQVLQGKIRVIEREKFDAALAHTEIKEALPEAMLIIEFLRKASKQIQSLSDHGLQALPDYQSYSAYDLRGVIDSEIHILATAIYHKNFKHKRINMEVLGADEQQSAAISQTLANENEVQV